MSVSTELTRRRFLGVSSLSVLLARLAPALAQGKLPSRTIPVSGEAVPVIGLGSTKAVLDIPAKGTGEIASVLRALLNLGGRVVDTSPRPESVDAAFGKALTEPDVRGKFFLSVKVNTTGQQAGVAQFRQTQRLFGQRTFDVVHVESLLNLEAHWPTLRGWKESGEARYIGVTVSANNLHSKLETFLGTEKPDFIMVNYSVMEPAAEQRLLPIAKDKGIAVLVDRPFMNGSYFERLAAQDLARWNAELDCTSWAQFSLKYILAHPAVTCVLTETTSPQHLEENVEAALGRLPDATTKQRMREFVERL